MGGGGSRCPRGADGHLTSSLPPWGTSLSAGGGRIWGILTCGTRGLAWSNPLPPPSPRAARAPRASSAPWTGQELLLPEAPAEPSGFRQAPHPPHPGGRFLAQICHSVLTCGPGHCPGQTA